ncbi:hypothetical protein PSTG_10452 [Puccinia striiformis f. sp. tritici PST-78]|uniref:Uncharacterized protein n=1 Tax=Puccinia striiformis f. sp. tritici PST-78 TaxID=1165861 RepID=A0A0L0VBG0_9BASI|nr:hypothetical protein PSTG_10452 [Puccinia striiformis f. sp. tritici PST-78]
MNSSSEREGVASNEDLTELRNRYDRLHSNKWHNDDQSLERLLGAASVSKVKEYLHGLAKAYSELVEVTQDLRNIRWLKFLLRKPGARQSLLRKFDLQEGGDLDNQFIKLAFFHQYPRRAQQENVSGREMLAALLTESIAAGEGLLAAAAINPQHYEIVQAGYRHPYLRQETISQPILHRISEYAHAWSENYLFPLTSLIGPSMIGKTRLLQQLSKSICVVYICLRPHGSTGQPPRSKLADQLFLVQKRASQLELQYTLLLAAIFDVVADFFSLQSAQTSEEERLLRWYEFNDESEMFASRVVQKLAGLSSTPDKAPAQLSTNLQKLHNSTCFIKNPHLKVLLAIDEARALVELQTCDALKLSYSRILRRVLATIPSSRGFFAIFTDTTSTVADTNPTLHNDNDPSGRPEPGSRPKKVFEPIYDIGTFDSKVPPGRPKTWADLLSPERLFSYGLPFFRIYVEEAKKSGLLIPKIIENVRNIAIQKLLCIPRLPLALSEGGLFALLGSTIQPQIYGATRLNSELISSHLAHCLYISPSRERIISEYPSQFTLSMAANYFLANNKAAMISCIEALTVILRQGLISAGNAGELASRIILLLAMHKAMGSIKSPEIPYGCSVGLADFLCALTGQEKEKLDLGDIAPEHKKRLLNEGRLFWNHFVQITYTPMKADLLEFLYRGLAIQCHPNQSAFHQMFTIYLEPGDSTSNLNEDHISFCGVQAKNGGVKFGQEMSKWTDEYAGININPENPYLVLVFSFEPKYTEPKVPKIDNRGHIIFQGLADIKCLSDGIFEALKELLAVEGDVRRFRDDDHIRTFVETTRPAAYRIQRPGTDAAIDFDSNVDPGAVGTYEGSGCEMND